MYTALEILAFLLVFFSASQDVSGQYGPWKKFTSTTGFSVMYPSTWYRAAGTPDGLAISSEGRWVEGVGITDDEGAISVLELRSTGDTTLSDLIAGDTVADSLVSSRVIPGSGPGHRHCMEGVWRSKDGPGTYEIDTAIYCDIGGRRFAVALRNFEGDRREKEYQRVALYMARSLRIEHGP